MRAVAIFTALFCFVTMATAQDRAAETAKQKTATLENVGRAGVDKPAVVETDDLVVVTPLTEEKTKPIADAAQRVYATSRKELKFEAGDKPWPGKLAVVVMNDPKLYTTFVRTVEQRRADKRETYSFGLRVDAPYVVTGPALGDKVTDAGLTDLATFVVAAAVLNKKAGTNAGSGTGTLPEWVQVGFAQAMAARAGRGDQLAKYKTKIKNAVVGKSAGPVRLWDVWDGKQTKDSDAVAASVVEYLMYGMDGGSKFASFIAGFKPSDMNQNPTVQTVFTSLEWSQETVEAGWKQWLVKLK